MDRPIDEHEAEYHRVLERSPVERFRRQHEGLANRDVAVGLGQAMQQLASRWKLRASMWRDHDHIAVSATDVSDALERCARELLGEEPL